MLHGDEIIQSAKGEINITKDPGLWFDFSPDDVAFWIACEFLDYQHHSGPFDKSHRYFGSGKSERNCLQNNFVG